MDNIKISVREIIDYVMRSGDIQAVFLSSKRAVDGIKAHQKFQKQTKEDYQAEVSISYEVETEDLLIKLTGRIDGIVKRDNHIIIDEIKSTGRSLEHLETGNELHWAQGYMYAYMYGAQEGLEFLGVRLTYIELETFQIKQFEVTKTLEELKKFFYEVINKYVKWAKKIRTFERHSIETIEKLDFPFDGYRKGQKKLMSSVYKTIENKKVLFSRAPTGIGKTVATLFPAIKAYGNERCDKIFYLTAKTIGKEVAVSTLQLLEEKGLKIKRVVITAKDKICLITEKNCSPEACIYAKGHYDRINACIEAVYNQYDLFDRPLIERYAKEYRVCPYELSLDLALFSGVIICDYNYVFDPSASLKRFFQEGIGRYVLLIDEAHNLVDRGREMYSAILEKQKVLDLKRKVKAIDKRLYQYFEQLNRVLIAYHHICKSHPSGCFVDKEMPVNCEEPLRGIIYRTEKIFATHKDWEHMNELLEFYFDGYDFIKKLELYDEHYITYYENHSKGLKVKLFCLDPSKNIKSVIESMQGVIYFSATLLPMDYYINLLGGDSSSYGLVLSSPFNRKNLCLMIDQSISTKYINRDISIDPIVTQITHITRQRQGNYMVFFPSYKYMEDVYHQFCDVNDNQFAKVMMQDRKMNEVEKEAFIKTFNNFGDKTRIAFVVLGGMFGEGIDLIGDKLIGAIIVSVGLPQISYERDIIKRHFDVSLGSGFEYAYVYPGMNKVMQSAGRVIRSSTDRGLVALLDERFNDYQYKQLFPDEWENPTVINDSKMIGPILCDFWGE